MVDAKSFNKLNHNLHQDVANLWDECFGDLPILTQRMLKAFGTISSPKAYAHQKIRSITPKEIKEAEEKIFQRDTCFRQEDIQTKQAQAITDKILKKMSSSNTQTSKFLKEFLKDKNVVVVVDRDIVDDACFGGFNPESKNLYIELCAGCFHYHSKYPLIFNEASLAKTIGHEIGHAVEQINRSSKSKPQSVGFSSNSWEVESFCDAFGSVLALQAGYSIAPSIEKMKIFEEQDEKKHKPTDPHPTLKQRRILAEFIDKAFPDAKREIPPFSREISHVKWDEKRTEDNSNIKPVIPPSKER